MRWRRAIRATLRVELRAIARSPLRAALVVVLIAIPVAALAGGATLLRTTLPSGAERAARLLGTADLRFDGGAADVARALASLPPGTRVDLLSVHPESIAAAGVRAAGLRARFAPDGLAAAMFRVVAGRPARAADEVAVAPHLADALAIRIGDTVELERDASRRTVVGLIVDPEALDRPVVATAADEAPPTGAANTGLARLPAGASIAGAAVAARRDAVRVRSARDAARAFDIEAALLFVFGTLGFVEAALVVAAAFAVGLRRRQREVGLLLASGAAPREIVAGILASATLLAIAGGLVGVSIGVGAAALLQPHLDAWTQRLNGPLELPLGQLAAAAALGVPTAALAAALPAARAARLPIRTALAGRRPSPRPPRRGAVLGLVTVAAGTATTVASLATSGIAAALCVLCGAVATVLGFGACSPWLLELLSRRVSRLPVALRLAVRDAGRARGRNGPVVTAVLSSMAFSVMLAAALRSSTALESDGLIELRDDQLRFDGAFAAPASQELAAADPGAAVAALRSARFDGELVHARVDPTAPPAWIAVGDDATLRALGLDDRAPRFADTLLAIGGPTDDRPAVLVAATTGRYVTDLTTIPVHGASRIPGLRFVMDPAEAARLGLTAGPPPDRATESWIVRAARPIDASTLDRARRIAARHPGTTVTANLVARQRPRILYAVALALSVLTGLLVVGAANALSSAESHRDRVILHTLGAGPGLARRHVAALAGYLTAVGCALAVPAGLVPAFGTLTAIGGIPVVVPWLEILMTVTIAPALAAAVAWIAPPRAADRV